MPALFPHVHDSLARQYGQPATAPRLRATTADECRSVIGGIIGEGRTPKSEATLDDLAANAIGIYRARATQVTPGFYARTPGSLVTAEVVSAIRSTPLVDTSHGLHVFFVWRCAR